MFINSRKLEGEKIILELEQENREYSLEELCTKLNFEQKKQQLTVLQYFDETVERLRTSGRLGYAAVFVSTRNYIKHFRNEKDFAFADVTHNFVVRFDEYLLKRGMKPNAAFVPMRTFKALLNSAKKEGLVRPDYDPFREFSFTKYRRDKPVKRALNREAIRKIEELDLKPGTMENHARNYFVFSYYCAGINFIDLAYLRWENIQQGRLVYVRRKTKEQLSPVLLEPTQAILEYYRTEFPNPAGYIFPILQEKHQTPESKDYRIDKVLRQVNKALKVIARFNQKVKYRHHAKHLRRLRQHAECRRPGGKINHQSIANSQGMGRKGGQPATDSHLFGPPRFGNQHWGDSQRRQNI